MTERARFWLILAICLVVQTAAMSCGVGFHPDPYHIQETDG